MAVPKWFALACGEGVTKAGSQVTQRGLISPHATRMTTPEASQYLLNVLFFVELFRALCGGALLGFKKESLRISKAQHLYAFAFAAIAFVMSIATLWAFQYGNADTSIAQFLELWSILIGALLDYFIFKDRVRPWQWLLGIPCFIVAGWVFLGRPDLSILLTPPLWLCLFILNAILLAGNEALARQMTQLKGAHLATNAQLTTWIGIWGTLLTLIALFIFTATGTPTIAEPFLAVDEAVILGVVIISLMVFFGLLFRLGSYHTPNVTITEKKFVSRLVALIATIILAPLFLANERFEAIRLLGMLIAIPGYYIIAWHRIIKEKSA